MPQLIRCAKLTLVGHGWSIAYTWRVERLKEIAGFVLLGLFCLLTTALVIYFAGNPEKYIIWIIGGAFVGSTAFEFGWMIKQVRTCPVRTIGTALAYLCWHRSIGSGSTIPACPSSMSCWGHLHLGHAFCSVVSRSRRRRCVSTLLA
jgi:hypothetical protein